MIIPLGEAVADTCGGKAGALGALLRAGLPVPDGFVLPYAAYRAAVRDLDIGRSARDPDRATSRLTAVTDNLATVRVIGRPDELDATRRAIEARPVHATVIEAVGRGLRELGDRPVAVRSSAAGEDTGQASAAGQHESFLAVRGTADVAHAVRACWASLFSPRAIDYRDASGRSAGDLAMAVIVQRHLDAEVSGVMFTPADADEPTLIEASFGLGPSVVGGQVAPDAYRVAGDGSVMRTVGDKRTRLDRHGARLVVSEVPIRAREQQAIDDATAERLAGLGRRIAAVLGGPQDIEWAIADGRLWVLQARPVTAAPPPPAPPPAAPPVAPDTANAAKAEDMDGTRNTEDANDGARTADTGDTGIAGDTRVAGDTGDTVLRGTPGSRGTVTGAARVVRGPGDFGRVRRGDILVCPFTDPAWTPLLRVVAGVVTETGGVLSHAAIVAREQAIPAVLGVADATSRLRDETVVTIDGTAGTVTAAG
ncbi:PEP/pyruvate-binding domain-containing protein [Sphaerisporangium sp. NPDC005289]|uniref:PEP/pyruvate-binding domain-containing protein n=1 Tax=Sphaerisporangium sp. NPDC005289 TaxID=3155247 RepID=UPI0033BD9D38